MNLQQLRYFKKLVECGKYEAAANELEISQSTLSKSIQKLEDELNAPLFYRRGRENKLTKYGSVFYENVSESLKSLDNGVTKINKINRNTQNKIRIGSVGSCICECVPLSINTFKKRYPDTIFTYYQGKSSEILNLLKEGEVDMALVNTDKEILEENNVLKSKILEYKVCLAVHESHPLAKKKNLFYEDIVDFDFIAYNEDTDEENILDEQLRSYHLEKPRNIVISCNTEEGAISAVSKNLGIALVSNAELYHKANIKMLEFDDIYLYFPIYMIWYADTINSPLITAYKEFVLKAHHKKSFTI